MGPGLWRVLREKSYQEDALNVAMRNKQSVVMK
jgi:hypothetical protein